MSFIFFFLKGKKKILVGVLTCFTRASIVVDSAEVLVPWDDQIVSLYFFIVVRKAQDKPHFPVLNLKVKPEGFTVLETIDIVDVMLGKFQPKLLVKGIYITHNPKYIGSAGWDKP